MTRHDYKLKLIYLLINEPMSTSEIAAKLGISRRTAQKMVLDLQRSEANLVKMGTKYGVHLESGWPWALGTMEQEPNQVETQA